MNQMRAMVDVINHRLRQQEARAAERAQAPVPARPGPPAPHPRLVTQLLSGQDSRRGPVSEQLWQGVGDLLRQEHPSPATSQRLLQQAERELSTARGERREGLTRTPRTPNRLTSPFASTRQSRVISP